MGGADPIAERVQSRALRAKVCSAEQAAALIAPGSTVGMSGFTGAGYPKAVPVALAQRIAEARDRGDAVRGERVDGGLDGPRAGWAAGGR